MIVNLKTALRRGLWFVNVGSALVATTRLRRDETFFLFESRSYTYGAVLEEARRCRRLT